MKNNRYLFWSIILSCCFSQEISALPGHNWHNNGMQYGYEHESPAQQRAKAIKTNLAIIAEYEQKCTQLPTAMTAAILAEALAQVDQQRTDYNIRISRLQEEARTVFNSHIGTLEAREKRTEELEAAAAHLKAKINALPTEASIRNTSITRQHYEELIRQMQDGLAPEKLPAKLGRAILQGFAGQNAWAFRGEKIDTAWDGIKLGLAVSAAQATSKVVRKHVETTVDRLIGGLWDSFINKLIECTQLVKDGLFHDGHRAFNSVEVKGLSVMVDRTFLDLHTMVNNGLKDMFRGSDMTLRLAEDQQETNHRTLGWRMLVGAYIRQIDYIIKIIELRLPYYDENDQIVFYAEEIVRCLEDVKRIISDVKNIREFDERLDSNKSIVNAIKSNIANLFARVLELVGHAPQNQQTYTPAKPSRGQGGYGYDHDERDNGSGFPHSHHG